MKSSKNPIPKFLKNIFASILLLTVLVNAGFLPVFDNYLQGKFVKIAYGQTDATIEANTKTFLGHRTGKRPDGSYSLGIYQDVLDKTQNEQLARQAADKAEANLYNAARDFVIAERNRNTGEEADAIYREKNQNFNDLLTKERLSAGTITEQQAQENISNNQETANQLEIGDQLSDAEVQERLAQANQNRRDEAAVLNSGGSVSPTQNTTALPINCGFGDGTLAKTAGLDGNIESCVAIIAYHGLKLSALFLHIVGALFNITLNFTLNIGKFIPQGSLGELGLGGPTGAIYIGWSTIRDFVNVAFIFVLLYAAISIILQREKYGLQQLIIKIVIAGLLINFSLFFAKAIVDFSNVIALQFYARILEASKNAGGDPNNPDSGLSMALQNSIGLQSIWAGSGGRDATAEQFGAGMTPYQLIAISIFGSVFILVFSFVLFMAGVQFMIRSIVLIFLLVTSPIAFLGGAIPGLEGPAGDWWKRMKNAAIFAPAYMAVLYISCLMIFGQAAQKVGGSSNLKLLFTSDNRVNAIGIVFWFIIVIGFLIAAHAGARKFADSFGSEYVGKAEKWFKSAPLLKYLGVNALARTVTGNVGRQVSEMNVIKKSLTAPGIRQIGGQKTYNAIKGLQEVKIGGKSYKDAIDERVKMDKTTFDRLGETTTRKRSWESKEDFEFREAANKNAAVRARAAFMGIDENATNIKTTDKTDAAGNPIERRKFFFWKEKLQTQAISEAALEEYRTKTKGTLGSGRRKSRKELANAIDPTSKKASPDDIEKQIKKASEDLNSQKDYLEADIKAAEDEVKNFRNINGTLNDDALHKQNLANQTYRQDYVAKMKALDKAKEALDKKQARIDALYRQLKQAQNADKK